MEETYSFQELNISIEGDEDIFSESDRLTLSDLQGLHDSIFKTRSVGWISVSLSGGEVAGLIAAAINAGEPLTNEDLGALIPEGAYA